MASKSIALLLIISLATVAASNSVALALVNALIAKTNFAALTATYGPVGFSAPAACSAGYPATLDFTVLNICYAPTANVYPFRNATAGYEFDMLNQWNALLNAQYGSTYSIASIATATTGFSTTFAALVDAVNKGNCQVFLSSIYKLATRDAVANSSCSYAQVYGGVLYNNNTYGSGQTVQSLNLPTVTYAVAAGSGSNATISPYFSNAIRYATNGAAATLDAISKNTNNVTVALGEGGSLRVYAANNPTGCNGGPCNFIDGQGFGLTASQVVAYTVIPSTTTAPTSSSPSMSTLASAVFVAALLLM